MEHEFLVESFKRYQEPWIIEMINSGDIKHIEVDEKSGKMSLVINRYHYLVLSKISPDFGKWKVGFSCEKKLKS